MNVILWIGLAACRGQELGGPLFGDDDPHPEVLAALEGSWQCLNSSDQYEGFVVQNDPPTVEVEWFRQVGAEGDADVPFETNCRYRDSGTRFEVEETTSAELPWTFQYTVDTVALVADGANSPACDTFVSRQNELAVDWLAYSFSFAEPVEDELVTSDWTCIRQ